MNSSRSLLVALALLAFASLDAIAAAPPSESPPIANAQIPAAIANAVDSMDRAPGDADLDAGRMPKQMLAFFGISSGMKVADLSAGGGWLTELLARTVGPTGKVYSVNGDFPPRFKKTGEDWRARLKKPALANVVAVQKPLGSADLFDVPPNTLDAVLIHLNYHDLVAFGVDPNHVNAEVFKALKPGGIYGIVDHSAEKGSGTRDAGTLHRIDEQHVLAEVEKAGFKLAARSSALRHPDDTRKWFVFQHRGQTDRFMLKFVKPK
ncbi:MAG: class I SAM-dependent methyltransferase [Candidatus Binataceae bacterium]